MCGDIFGCHKQGGGVTGICWVEARDVARHPTVHETALVELSTHIIVPKLGNPAPEQGLLTYITTQSCAYTVKVLRKY